MPEINFHEFCFAKAGRLTKGDIIKRMHICAVREEGVGKFWVLAKQPYMPPAPLFWAHLCQYFNKDARRHGIAKVCFECEKCVLARSEFLKILVRYQFEHVISLVFLRSQCAAAPPCPRYPLPLSLHSSTMSSMLRECWISQEERNTPRFLVRYRFCSQ